MVWTTVPSYLIALTLYLIIGLRSDVGSDSVALEGLMATLDTSFNITPIALLPLLVVFVLAMRKVPPLPTILSGALLGGILAGGATTGPHSSGTCASRWKKS